jgi:hypothetical protein
LSGCRGAGEQLPFSNLERDRRFLVARRRTSLTIADDVRSPAASNLLVGNAEGAERAENADDGVTVEAVGAFLRFLRASAIINQKTTGR